MRLGVHQLRTLMFVASPFTVLVAGDAVDRSLIARGLLRPDGKHGATITPDGLRAVADAIEAGQDRAVYAQIEKDKAERAARRKQKEQRRGRRAA